MVGNGPVDQFNGIDELAKAREGLRISFKRSDGVSEGRPIDPQAAQEDDRFPRENDPASLRLTVQYSGCWSVLTNLLLESPTSAKPLQIAQGLKRLVKLIIRIQRRDGPSLVKQLR